MKFYHPYFLILLVLTGCGKPLAPLPPEGFIAQAKLSAGTLLVGDPVTLTLTARHPAGSTISFPNIGDGKKVVVRGRFSGSREDSKTILKSEEIYQLTSFRTGDWTVTTNPVVCAFSGGVQKMQALPKLVLHVQSSLNATNAATLSDIKDIVKPPLQISRKLLIFLVIALLALIAGIATHIFLSKPRTILQMPPPEPPHIIARLALNALRGKPWSPEPFFTELSLILRTYLENRFDLNAPESTTEELARSMSSDTRLELREQQTLRNFMTQADLVKFARAGAEQDVMQNAFATVESFVEQTKEEPQPEVKA
ncbi:MAG: hypothetical protein WC334_04655 [Kiritimatiellales bacterium]|jgi:hypothetical protein